MHTFSFSFFSSVCYVFVLFCFVVFLIFQAETSSFLFHLIAEKLILHIFLIIMIIIRCSGMFRDVPGCSGMFRDVPECSGIFHVPAFIDARPVPAFGSAPVKTVKNFTRSHNRGRRP